MDQDTELEGGISHPIEELEELRLFLASFLKPELLDQLVLLYKELSTTTQEPKMYAWFVRNSSAGKECRYAVAALDRFKKKRLDKMEEILEQSLIAVRNMKD